MSLVMSSVLLTALESVLLESGFVTGDVLGMVQWAKRNLIINDFNRVD